MNPFETTTESGTRVIITPSEGVNLPSTLSELGSTIKNASLPSNQQIDQALEDIKEVLEEEGSQLNPKGQTLAKDAEEIIDSTSKLLHSKNKNDKLQKLLSETKDTVMEEAEKVKEGGKKLVGEGKKLAGEASNRMTGLYLLGGKAQTEVEDLYSYIRHLGFNFIRSEDFRQLATDWIRLFQALGAEKIKKQARKKRKLTHTKAGKNIAQAVDEGIVEPEKPESEEELMEQTQKELYALIDKISKSKEYQKVINDFYKLYDELKEKLFDAGDKLTEEAKKLKSTLDSTLDVVSEFTGKDELSDFKDSLTDAFESVTADKKLSSWFSELRKFMTQTIQDPQSIASRKEDVTELLKKGRNVLQQAKWRKLFNGIYEGLNGMLDKIKSDTTLSSFSETIQQFGKDFALNEKGMPDLFVLEDSVSQMKNMIIPLFRKQLDKLPIKRIEFINDTYDVTLEDMITVGSSFLPETMDIHMQNDSHMNFMDGSEDSMSHVLEASVANIKPEFRNVKFHYKRKHFPTIEDFGMADISFTGEGASIKVVWKIEVVANSYPVATLEQATCNIDSLNIRIIGEATKHEILDTLLAPFLAGMLKTKIANGIEEYLNNQLGSVNDQLNKFFASRPTQQLKQKANEAMLDTFQKFQETVKSV